MPTSRPDTDELLAQAAGGDTHARSRLLIRHRDRLRRMVACRFDPRLAARVDPSDVVQEVLLEADRKLNAFMKQRPLPFYPWLRQLAVEHLIDLNRRHLRAANRTVRREEANVLALPDGSAAELAGRLVTSATSPSQHAVRRELRQRVQQALQRLGPRDREVLVLRHLEQLSVAETAAVLGLTPGAVKVRALRALERLRALLDE